MRGSWQEDGEDVEVLLDVGAVGGVASPRPGGESEEAGGGQQGEVRHETRNRKIR